MAHDVCSHFCWARPKKSVMLSLFCIGVFWQMMLDSARIYVGQEHILGHAFLVFCWGFGKWFLLVLALMLGKEKSNHIY